MRRPAVISRQDNRGAAHGSFALFLDNFSSGEDNVTANLKNSSTYEDKSSADLKNSSTYEDKSSADLKNSSTYEDKSSADQDNSSANLPSSESNFMLKQGPSRSLHEMERLIFPTISNNSVICRTVCAPASILRPWRRPPHSLYSDRNMIRTCG